MAHKEKTTGQQRFEEYYHQIYLDRWENLKASMLEPSCPVRLEENLPDCKLASPYYMDKASILAASMLPVSENCSVLDMCAAPGGKTLVLASRLKGTGSLVSNDRSASRRNRLISVINECLEPELRANIKVTGHDSSKWGLYEKDMYDMVLLDAPCSSERHVLNDQSALDIWGPNRPKQLSIMQFAMLASAMSAVKVGGYILYSTCSINPMENELVIEKLGKKRVGCFEEVDMIALKPELESLSEGLSHGRIVLPDKQASCGPLYFCLIRRTN